MCSESAVITATCWVLDGWMIERGKENLHYKTRYLTVLMEKKMKKAYIVSSQKFWVGWMVSGLLVGFKSAVRGAE